MAIWLEFYNIIVPIKVIENKYPGGFKAFKEANKENFEPADSDLPFLWHDIHLCRIEGAMNLEDLQEKLDEVQKLMNLKVLETIDGLSTFKDVYITGAYQGSNCPCHWIVEDMKRISWGKDPLTGEPYTSIVEFCYLKGTELGLIAPLEEESIYE